MKICKNNVNIYLANDIFQKNYIMQFVDGFVYINEEQPDISMFPVCQERTVNILTQLIFVAFRE